MHASNPPEVSLLNSPLLLLLRPSLVLLILLKSGCPLGSIPNLFLLLFSLSPRVNSLAQQQEHKLVAKTEGEGKREKRLLSPLKTSLKTLGRKESSGWLKMKCSHAGFLRRVTVQNDYTNVEDSRGMPIFPCCRASKPAVSVQKRISIYLEALKL